MNSQDSDNAKRSASAPPLGSVEPHAGLLKIPNERQTLFKVMSTENLIASISGRYLYFNRVDSYKDFHGADACDGKQLPSDYPGNASTKFEKAPDFSIADYYNQCRSRTYACCFSLDNSDYIWRNYGAGGTKGKVCVAFDFGKLRTTLNKTFELGNAALISGDVHCHQIFSINYGLVEYVDWQEYQANNERLPNPIQYIHFKDRSFASEKELRVSLSATGMGQFVLEDGGKFEFHPALPVSFDFKSAIGDGTIQQILQSPDCDPEFIQAELDKHGIRPRKE